MEVLGFFLAIVMGLVLGLLGGGGSILTVPILFYVFQVNATLSTAYSLFIVGTASALAAFDYHKRGLIDYKVGTFFAIPALLSVYSVRRFVIPRIPEELGSFAGVLWTKDSLILTVFAIVMLLASVMMIRGRKDVGKVKKKTPPILGVIGEGVIVGGITGFVGAGGGFMIIPALVLLAGLEMKVAVGTSLFIITIKSLLGFIGDVQSAPEMDWVFLGIFTFFSMVGIFVGTKFSRRVDSKTLKPAFGWFVLVMGVLMLGKEVWG